MKKKIIVGISSLAFLGSLIQLWNANHGFIAFVTASVAGIFLVAGILLMFEKEDHTTKAVIFAVIGAVIAVWVSVATGSSDYEDRLKKDAKAAETTAKNVAEQARRDALTPAERKKEDDQKSFETERTARGLVLYSLVKKSAFDPDALKLKGPNYYKDGVCVSANGKNRFGAYVGWQDYCYTYKNSKWDYNGPN
jgi:hypothetical protein